MEDKLSCNRHIYLYAKRWYKRTDVINDLRIIMAERCGAYNGFTEDMQKRLVSINDAVQVLLHVTYPYIIAGGDHLFFELLNDISPANSWKCNYYTQQSKLGFYPNQKESFPEYDYTTALVYKCLSILCYMDVTKITDVEKGQGIGEADWDLFPMFKPDQEEMERLLKLIEGRKAST